MSDEPIADDESADEGVDRCDFCRQPRPVDAVSVEIDGRAYRCCTEACRDALLESNRVFTDAHDHRRFRPGVAGLDASLPQGLPRNSFVLLLGHSGTREESIQAELVWRTLERGENAVIASFTEPPTSVVENFLTLDWNVLPFLEDGRLEILDCFTYRVDDRDRLYDRMSDWNRHVHRIVDPQTVAVRDPTDGQELRNKLDNCLGSLGMLESGVVVIDSLAEFASLVQPVQAYDFVKDVRAEVCKGRFVPIVAGATIASDEAAFPRDLEYVADGVIDLHLDGSIVEDTLFRRLRVRKMRGVLTIPEWHTYEYTSGLGLVTFDPQEEMTDDEEAAGDGDEENPSGETDGGEDG